MASTNVLYLSRCRFSCGGGSSHPHSNLPKENFALSPKKTASINLTHLRVLVKISYDWDHIRLKQNHTLRKYIQYNFHSGHLPISYAGHVYTQLKFGRYKGAETYPFISDTVLLPISYIQATCTVYTQLKFGRYRGVGNLSIHIGYRPAAQLTHSSDRE